MFARRVSMCLKANLPSELTRTFDEKILPLLQKQAGFQGGITLAVRGGTEAVAISEWDKKENSEAYDREPNPQLRRTLEKFIEGAPAIQTDEVVHSTFHPIAGKPAART